MRLERAAHSTASIALVGQPSATPNSNSECGRSSPADRSSLSRRSAAGLVRPRGRSLLGLRARISGGSFGENLPLPSGTLLDLSSDFLNEGPKGVRLLPQPSLSRSHSPPLAVGRMILLSSLTSDSSRCRYDVGSIGTRGWADLRSQGRLLPSTLRSLGSPVPRDIA